MNRNKNTEIKDDKKQKPKKKVPRYLKYVAKKSKAGFGKVHEELLRMFSESVNSADKCTGQVKLAEHSFISYIPVEKEDLGSSTSTCNDFDMLLSELDVMNSENNTFHNDEMCSTSVYDKNQNKFNVNNIRLSMPHLDLTNEAIYANDRVLLVEADISSLSDKDEETEDPAVIYSVPKPKYKPQHSHEIDDYVNLRDPYHLPEVVIRTEKIKEVKSTKNEKPVSTPEPRDKAATNKTSYKVAKYPPFFKLKDETQGSHNTDDEDTDYLPPSRWTQSCYGPATDAYLYATVEKKQTSNDCKSSEIVTNNSVCNSNINIRTGVKEDDVSETDDSYYVPPSEWVNCNNDVVSQQN